MTRVTTKAIIQIWCESYIYPIISSNGYINLMSYDNPFQLQIDKTKKTSNL